MMTQTSGVGIGQGSLKNITYSNQRPKGFPTRIQNREFISQLYDTQRFISDQQIIRFMINESAGFWDPYSARLQFQVEYFPEDTDPNVAKNTILQIDGSGHSLISKLQIIVKGIQIEYIEDYDSLLHLLLDMQYYEESKKTRICEGVGIGLFSNQSFVGNFNTGIPQSTIGIEVINNVPTDVWQTQRPNFGMLFSEQDSNDVYEQSSLPENSKSINIKRQADLTQDINRFDTCLINGDFTHSLSSFDPNLLVFGNQGCLAANFSNQNWEQYFTNISYKSLKKGEYSQTPRKFMKITIPLFSGLLGTIMPPDNYKFIPMKALQDLIIEITPNRYFCFSSGMRDDIQKDQNTNVWTYKTGNQFLRDRLKITKASLMVDIVYFQDMIIEQTIDSLLRGEGILLHTNSWRRVFYKGGLTSTTLNGDHQINQSFESIKVLLMIFENEDYQNYNFCRKHFRLNCGITSLQARVGDKYVPEQPQRGQANTNIFDGNTDNYEFVYNLYRCFNKDLALDATGQINSANFAVNKRYYTVSNTTTTTAQSYLVIDESLQGYTNVKSFQANFQRFLNQLGLPLFHENAVRGMAAFGILFDGINRESQFVNGTNTYNNTPWNIMVRAEENQSAKFTALWYAYFDIMYIFKLDETPKIAGVL